MTKTYFCDIIFSDLFTLKRVSFLILLFIFIIFTACFILLEGSNPSDKIQTYRREASEYLDEFKMYLCFDLKLLLFPPKEIFINNRYHTLNLTTNNNLLKHRNIFSKNHKESCVECLNRCLFDYSSSKIIYLELSFNDFKKMTNDELKVHLKRVLSEEQYNTLFNIEN